MPSLSELEFGLILLGHAFDRWMVHCAAASGVADLSPLDVLVLHTVNHRGRGKRLADICLEDPRVRRAEVTLHKPGAPIEATFTDVTLTITRTRTSTGAESAGCTVDALLSGSSGGRATLARRL